MSHQYEVETIKELALEILQAGYRPFIAERGHYGFFTNEEGTRIVSFQCGLDGIQFSGCYRTNEQYRTGSGWRLGEADADSLRFDQLLDSSPPLWAVGRAKWEYTTLEQHLKTFQASSQYKEVVKLEMPKLSFDDIKALIPHIIK